MLYHASQRAGLPLPQKRQYNFSEGKPNYYAPYDGIFLPNSNSFWYGVIHHENYKEKECFYIVFSPENANISVYRYDPAKASQFPCPILMLSYAPYPALYLNNPLL